MEINFYKNSYQTAKSKHFKKKVLPRLIRPIPVNNPFDDVEYNNAILNTMTAKELKLYCLLLSKKYYD